MAVGPGRPQVIFALTLALQSAQITVAVRQPIEGSSVPTVVRGSGPGRGRGQQQLRQQGQLLRVPSSATAVAASTSTGRGAPCACEAYSASWRYAQKRPPTCLFIDLGAADGETFKAFLHQSSKWSFNYSTGPFRHKDCYAYLMEANPKFGQHLEQFRTDHVYPMTTTAAYMCDKPKERFYLDVKGPGGWGSSLDHDHEAVSADTSKQAVDVQLYNLMRLLQENALPEDNVVVKMDIEGAEYDILPCLADSPAATLIDTLYLEDHCPGDWWCPTTGQAGNSKQVFTAALQKLKQRGVAIPDGYWSPMTGPRTLFSEMGGCRVPHALNLDQVCKQARAMVLTELGQKITGAFRRLNTAAIIDDDLLDEVLKEIAAALLQADVNVRYVSELRSNVRKRVLLESDAGGVNKRKLIQKAVVEELVRMMSADRKPYKLEKGACNIIMFVGLQGSGKTTTCTKYAHYYNRKGWRTALVCADTFRAGAFDQLRQNASKVRIPFYGDYNETDPVKIAEEGVELFKKEKYDLIIVDTSGRHKQEQALFDEMKQVAEAVQPNDIVFIMDSHIGQACYEQAKAFRECVNVGSVIITKLDGHAKGGGALSAVAATNSPIVFLGTGEHFDEFQTFEAQSFVSRLLGMGDLKGLFQTITEAMPLDKQPELLNKISKGKFSLRDLYEQFQNLQKMGPMGQIMQMIPGMAQLMPKGAEKEGVKRIKRFMVMMDSLTDDELDCNVQMTDSRRLRVAKGSGSSHGEVSQLLDEYKRMEKMVGKMGKSGLFGKGGDLTQLTRNPGQVMQKMQSAMDPRMLQQMGGAQNMMKMMKEFGKMENMGGMMESLGGIDPSQLQNMQKMMGKMKGGRR